MALILLGTCLLPGSGSGSGPEADPVPIRRRLVSPEEVPAALEKVRSGVLKKLPYAEFQDKLRQAARAARGRPEAPRLIEASYTATLKGSALEGNGEWTVLSPAGGGILPLPDLNLALRGKVQFRPGAAEAVLGDLDGKNLGLLVKGGGREKVVFDWTARGERRSEGLHFTLRVPACAVASLELTLPGDRLLRLSPQNNGVVSRVHRDARESRWRVRFAGRSELGLVVRPTGGFSPVVLSRVQTTQELAPGRLRARFDFHVEVLRTVVRKLYFAYDPALRPYDVRAEDLDLKWRLVPGPRAGAPGRLVVELSRPVLDPLPTLSVLCLGPPASDGPWVSPGLRLVKALPWGKSSAGEGEKGDFFADPRLVSVLPRGETLTLRISPELQLERWQAGNFRFVKTEPTPDRPPGSVQVLTLAGPGPMPGARAVRPGAWVRTRDAECVTRQLTWWQIGPNGQALTTGITVELARGRLSRLALGLPPGWELQQVQASPRGLVRDWAPLADGRRTLLVADLQRPLSPQTPLHLTVRLRAPAPGGGRAALPFPDVEPLDARYRVGALGIGVDPYYRVRVGGASPPAGIPDEAGAADPPWGASAPDLLFPFRQRVGLAAGPDPTPHPALSGRLLLRPRRARVRAACTTEAILAPGHASARLRLQLEPDVGHPQTIELLTSAAPAGGLEWRAQPGANRVVRAVPRMPQLLALAAGSPMSQAALLTVPPRWQWWRLTLARPLAEPLTLQAALPLVPDGSGAAGGGRRRPEGRLLEVPLLAVPNADLLEGEVKLFLAGVSPGEVKSVGLREAPVPPREGIPSDSFGEEAVLWRRYSYGSLRLSAGGSGRRPSLSLLLPARPAGRTPEERIDRCDFTTFVEPTGRLLHHLSFQARSWRRPTLPVRLPPGAEPLAVKAYARWEDPLPLARSSEGVWLDLPVASDTGVHPFEILYSSPGAAPGWLPWTRLEAPLPGLPVRALLVRTVWRLPPGLTALTRGGMRRLPGPCPPGLPDWLRSFAGRGTALGPGGADGVAAQRQLLFRAGRILRRQLPRQKSWTLGEMVNRLVFDQLRGQAALVLDGQALRAAGLGPETPYPRAAGSQGAEVPVWEDWGLVYVSFPGAPLLTTRGQWRAWQAAAGPPGPECPGLEAAVRAAAVHGHDDSGRFVNAADWLRSPGPSEGLPAGLDPGHVSGESFAGWEAWEPLAGAEGDAWICVVRPRLVTTLGLILTGVFLLGAWRLRASLAPRWRFRLLLSWAGGFGLALVWLPAALRGLATWPLLAGWAVAQVWYLRSVLPGPTPSSRRTPGGPGSSMITAGLVLAGCTSLAGQAAGPAPATILLLPGPPQAPDRLTALVTPALWQRLEDLTRRGTPSPPGAVLLSAEYRQKPGTVVGATADVEADFQVYCFAKEATLTVPLGDVVLRPRGEPPLAVPGFFAGKPVYPVALPRGRKGYAVPLRVEEPGTYPLKLRFTAAVAPSGDERSLRFLVPPLVRSRLALDLPAGARNVRNDTGLGAQQVVLGPAGVRFETDLGRVAEVLLRWRVPGERPLLPVVKVQESYLWDLRPSEGSLSGTLYYRVTRGALGHLEVGLPDGLEVRGAEVRPWPPEETGPEPHLLNRTLRLERRPGLRVLRIDLDRPAAGSLQLLLELIPHLPAGPGTVPLFLPVPEPGRRELQLLPGSLAFRVEGFEPSARGQHLSLVSLPPGLFSARWRKGFPKANDPGPPRLAYSFQRKPGGPAGVNLTLQPAPLSARQKILWQIGRRFADLEAAATVSAANPFNLVECDVPGVVVPEVSGPQVLYWTQADSRLQVWLKSPRRSADFRVRGWLPMPPPGTAPPTGAGRLALPCLRIAGARTVTTDLAVAGTGGWDLEPVRLHNLSPAPERAGAPGRDVGRFSFRTQQPDYQAVFSLRRPRVAVRLLTRVEVDGPDLLFHGRVDYEVARGEVRALRLRVRNWPGRVEPPEGAGALHRSQRRLGRAEQVWTLTLRPGLGRRFSLRLGGKVPLDSAPSFLMPELLSESPEGDPGLTTTRGRWLAVREPGVEVREAQGLTPVAGPARRWPARPGEPGEDLRGYRVWRAGEAPWRLRLRPAPAAGRAPVRLLLTEQAAAVGDGRRWLHQAVYRLYAERGADLGLVLPPGARPVAVSIDRSAGAPFSPSGRELRLALSGGPEVHAVRVTWVFGPGEEDFERPNLARPRLRTEAGDLADAPCLWCVQIPAGYGVERGSPRDGEPLPASAAGQDVRRAAVELRLCARLLGPEAAGSGNRGAAPLADAQERFAWFCRQAEYRLELAGKSPADAGPRGQGLPEWLAQLREENRRLMRAHGQDKLRLQAEARVRTSPSAPGSPDAAGQGDGESRRPDREVPRPRRGTPAYWQSEAPRGEPHLTLSPAVAQANRKALAASGLLLAAFLAAWCLSYLPALVAGFHHTWPEQIVLLGAALWLLFDLPLAGIALVAAGAGARLYLVGLWLAGLLSPARPAGGAAGPGPASP